jgi:hypothetical protein
MKSRVNVCPNNGSRGSITVTVSIDVFDCSSDVTDGGQDDNGGEPTHAGELHEQSQAVVLGGDSRQGFFQVGDLRLGEGLRVEVGLDTHLFERRDGQSQPPGALSGSKQIACGV